MILLLLFVFGFVLGSFVNAFVWRLHEQEKLQGKKTKQAKQKLHELSIVHGRSMCSRCGHELAAKDLVPVFSWLWLRGKCRYCHKPIQDSPLVELSLPVLFVISYMFWPLSFQGYGLLAFCLWLVFLTGFAILTVYDIKWFLLPDKVVWPLVALAIVQVVVHSTLFNGGTAVLFDALWGVLVASGFFYVLYVASDGKWIGGGDVKLGLVIGLLLGGPLPSLLMLFLASTLGTLASLPLLINKKMGRSSLIPFGPFLMAATAALYLFNTDIMNWLNKLLLL